MLEALILGVLVSVFSTGQALSHRRTVKKRNKLNRRPAPGLSSQRSQITPVPVSKNAYLGPMTAKRRKALQTARRKRKHS